MTESALSREGSALRAVLISDLVASTRLVEEIGDRRAADLFARHDRLARDLLSEHEGLEIDKTDGFLMLFEHPLQAVAYALGYHQALGRLSEEYGHDLSARVGIHLGDVFLRRNPPDDVTRGAKPLEVEGLAKPTAARLMSLAGARQTLLTRGAFDVARRAAVGNQSLSEDLEWLAHGGYRIQGVTEPTEIFEVGSRGFAPLEPPPDSEKVKRVDPGAAILGWRPAAGQPVPRREKWLLDQKVGEGGFGEVWLARHEKTGDRRVFKFCFDAERLRALQREITVFRLLKEELGERPDIARILEWSFDQPPYFIESEYTAGGSLIDWAEAQGGLAEVPLATRLRITAQVAEALAAAHSVGVLHRDVKPGNVLIHTGPSGAIQARVCDFGMGVLTEEERLTSAGITVLGMTRMIGHTEYATTSGTLLYQAPELVEGKAATIQADVYALGVLLYQLVVGNLFRALGPGWERGVEDELVREDIAAAVDVNPGRRFSGALEFAERLRSLDSRRAERVKAQRQKEARERASRAAALTRRRQKIGAVLFVAISLFAVAMVFQSRRVAREAERANREAERARIALRVSVARVMSTDPTRQLALIREIEADEPLRVRGWQAVAQEAMSSPVAEVLLEGHEHEVVGAFFSPDGARVVTASRDNTARVWNADGSGVPVVLRGHQARLRSASWSPDGTRIVTASRDNTARVWSADGSGVPVVLEGHLDSVISAVFSPDGSRIATASWDHTARVWNADGSGTPVVLRGHINQVWTAFFSPDGGRIITASSDGTARVWNADGSGTPVLLRGHEDVVRRGSFSPDGARVVTVSFDGTARVWNADGSGTPVVLHHEPSSFGVSHAAFSPDGGRIVTSSSDLTARVWNADGSGGSVVLRGHTGTLLFSDWSPDGARVVTASTDGSARVWRTDGTGVPVIFPGHEGVVWTASWSPDGTRIVTASTDGTARVWEFPVSGLPVILKGHEEDVTSAVFDSDGARVVSASFDGTARVWRADGSGDPVVLQGHEEDVTSAVFDSGGTRVVTASFDSTARVWSADGSSVPRVLRGHAGPLLAVAWSPDGTHIATASSDRTARVWNADDSGVVVLVGHEDDVWSVSFSSEGTRIVTTSDDTTARVWNSDGSGTPVVLRGHEAPVWSAAWSPDGSRIATASWDHTARVWNADGSGVPVVLEGHEDEVWSVAWSPDGTRIVTGSQDKTARVWNADGTDAPVVLVGHEALVISAAFSPDGARVATASSDSTARVWNADGSGVPVVLVGHEEPLDGAVWSPDGTRVVTASQDGTARVWSPDLELQVWRRTPVCLSVQDRMTLLDQDEPVAALDRERCRRMVLCLQESGDDGFADCHRELRRSQEAGN